MSNPILPSAPTTPNTALQSAMRIIHEIETENPSARTFNTKIACVDAYIEIYRAAAGMAPLQRVYLTGSD